MRRLLPLLLAAVALLAVVPAAARADAQVRVTASPSSPVAASASWTVASSLGADPFDVSSVWLAVDGVKVATSAGPLLAPVALTADTSAALEGPHAFAVGWTGLDGVDAVVQSISLTVDRTAPLAPVPVSPATQLTTDRDVMDLRWSPPPGETGGTAVGVICDPASCRALVNGFARSPMPLGTYAHLHLAMGVTTVRVWWRDAAGNADSSRSIAWTITRTRVDPGLSIATAKVGRDRRTVTVGGLLKVAHTNKVSVSVKARYGKRTRTVRAIAVTSGNGWATQLRLPSARWTTATVTARVAGTSRYLTVERTKTIRRR